MGKRSAKHKGSKKDLQGVPSPKTADQGKHLFLANISHEIRTPLNAIVGFAEGIIKADGIETAQSHARIILHESEHLLSIVKEILDHAKIEAGNVDIKWRCVDLSALQQSIVSFSNVTIKEKNLEFHVSIADDVPLYIKGDFLRLRQVLMNLIGNAIKFTKEGSIHCKVETLKADDKHSYLRFSIIDTGVGIAKDRQAIIFDSFIQADESPTREFGGTGLGTSISKKLVELMGGQIGVESTPGKGSTFWFTIPFDESDLPSEEEQLARLTEDYDYEPENVRQAHILVVEDYEPNQDVVKMLLVDAGHTVDIAEDGKQAIAMCEENRYDVILMDVQMPVMDGFTATKHIRSGNSPCRDIPVIALTANAEGETQKGCLNAGMNDVVTKPVRRKHLCNVVNKWLVASDGNSQSEDEPEETGQIRILVADDSECNQSVVRNRLGNSGYIIDIAEDGEEAVAMCKRNYYSLILVDIQMPKMNGIDATRNIRSESSICHDTNIIGLTAHIDEKVRQACLEAGMNDVICKTVRCEAFLDTINNWINSTGKNSQISGNVSLSSDTGDFTKVPDDSPFDFEEAIREFGGNRDLVSTVMDKFISKVEEQIQILKEALKRQDSETIRKEAHKIRGGAANLTAMSLAMSAEKLEGLAQKGASDEIAEHLVQLEKEFDKLKQFV